MDEGHPATQEPADRRLRAVFDDLEQQAAGMALAERDAELLDRARGEYAAVDLTSRIHASLGRQVALTLTDGQRVEGALDAAGADWCAVASPRGQSWLVPLAAITTVTGGSSRAAPPAVRPVSARLGLGSALHRLSEQHGTLLVALACGDRLRGQVTRIGADFAELRPGDRGDTVLVAFTAISAVRAERAG